MPCASHLILAASRSLPDRPRSVPVSWMSNRASMMTFLVAPRQRFPLIITGLGLTLLSLFFLFPLSRIFDASFLDPKGTHFTLANYAKILGSAFYQQAVANS